MKILHTADWHLGKYLNNFDLLKDQEHILVQIIELIKKERPDVILLAGDIYDRSVAPAEAVRVFDEVMSQIILDLKIPVIAIAGNHDNAHRISYCNAILQKQGLHIFGNLGDGTNPPMAALPQITLKDKHGEVHFFPIPYTEPETLRYYTKDQQIRTHQDVMNWVTAKINEQCPTGRRVLIAHAFVAGGATSESERDLLVGGAAYIEANTFESFTYTALGHLHQPQLFLKAKVCYAGSPMKYSFSEAHHKKSVAIITLDQQGIATHQTIDLKPLHDMHRVKGRISNFTDFEITSQDTQAIDAEDFLEITLENEEHFLNPMAIIQKHYINAMHLRRPQYERQKSNKTINSNSLQTMNEVALFTAFFKRCHADKELSLKQTDFLNKIIKDLENV